MPRKLSAYLFHAANTDVQRNAAREGSHAHHFGEKFGGAVPRRRGRICKRDFQAIPERVLAVTAKAQALGRNINGHGLFKPGNSFRMNANRNRESHPHAAAPFVFAMMRISVGSGALAFFQMNCNSKGRGSFGDADSARELVRFCGKLSRRRAPGLRFFARICGTNDFKFLLATNDVSGHFGLSVAQRSVIRKSDPDTCSASMCLLHGNQQAAARDVDGLCQFDFLAKRRSPSPAYRKTHTHAAMLAAVSTRARTSVSGYPRP